MGLRWSRGDAIVDMWAFLLGLFSFISFGFAVCFLFLRVVLYLFVILAFLVVLGEHGH
jgi:hypothetical protein